VWFPIRIHEAAEPPPLPIRYVPTAQKVVALTYDDGPHSVFTPELLSILRRYRVPATFFVIGDRAAQFPEIVREIAMDGHVIANHTYSHPNNLEYLPTSRITEELDSTQRLIKDLTGRAYKLFRPPKGWVNRRLAEIVQSEGYTVVLWSVSADHHEAKTPEEMAKRVIKRIRPGAIVLMHDGRFPVRWRDVVATPLIIRGLRKKGYRFVTVPELLNMLETRDQPSAKNP
jgi:peptidoglycan/xylan/chitin deacetylase (PgdA/CDA1 family)